MPQADTPNPAQLASTVAWEQLRSAIDARQAFILEAGAGAGKTYSLVETLRHLLAQQGASLVRGGRRIACITFTNVAKDEILARTDNHPAVLADTIHGFCWSVIRQYQVQLREFVQALGKEPFDSAGDLSGKLVEYDLGRRRVGDHYISLHHDDIIPLTVRLLDNARFRAILAARFPVILVDEYQDTDSAFVAAVERHFLGQPDAPLIGFFGDRWQQIYNNDQILAARDRLREIKKGANFRSVQAVVDVLNRFRPDLQQVVEDPQAPGLVSVFHTNAWRGTRRSGSHWAGDLPGEDAHAYLRMARVRLEAEGWDFSPSKTRILMLTHNVLAAEQGYRELSAVFAGRNDAFIKKEDPHIKFLVDLVEPMAEAYAEGRYAVMFEAAGMAIPPISTLAAKQSWNQDMRTLGSLRESGTVGQVIDHLLAARPDLIPEKVSEREAALGEPEPDPESTPEWRRRVTELRNVPYRQIIALRAFIEGNTPFATQHGVKGAEFENVLVVIGRGWQNYNFAQMLELWHSASVPAAKRDGYLRARNLFYVAISRPRNRLAVLFTQVLSESALSAVENLFGHESVVALSPLTEEYL